MPLIHDSAIVLSRLEYSESSQILAMFTRTHGKVRVIAKGVRRSTKKRFSPGIDLLEAGAVVLSVRHVAQEALATLTEWKQVCAFGGLRERLVRLQAAQYSADIVAQLTEDWDPHPPLYDALYSMLKTISDLDDALPSLVEFQRVLLDQAGLFPRFDACVGCGRPPEPASETYFTSLEGGLICRDCEPARVEKRLVRARLGALIGAEPAGDADVAGMFDLFNYHISHLIGREPAGGASLLQPAQRSSKPTN